MTADVLDEVALKQFVEDVGPEIDDLIDFFIIDIRGKMDELAAISDEPDVTTLTIHAHSLKGLSRTCGMAAIADLAYALEGACRGGAREQAAAYVADLSKNLEPAIDALKAFVAIHRVPQPS
jgi:HPt (histidine-containing phosphotransfer) domain-containing protein